MLSNPLKGIKKPPAKIRGAEVLIDPKLHQRLLEVVSPEFRVFLRAVQATGARPGQVARVEAKDVQWDAACWVLTEHKTARTGRVRTIYLPEAILSICSTLAEKYPTGPLFRNTRGEPWRKTGWKQAMGRVQKKLGLARRPLTSGYRHTFATDALEVGAPDTHLAELLGHSTTSMSLVLNPVWTNSTCGKYRPHNGLRLGNLVSVGLRNRLPQTAEYLACPQCRGRMRLDETGDGLVCPSCTYRKDRLA